MYGAIIRHLLLYTVLGAALAFAGLTVIASPLKFLLVMVIVVAIDINSKYSQ